MNKHHRFAYLLLGALLSPLSAAYAQTEEPRITRAQASGTITADIVSPLFSRAAERFVLNPDGTGFFHQHLSGVRSTGERSTPGVPMRWEYRQGTIVVVLNAPLVERSSDFEFSIECGYEVPVDYRLTRRRFILSVTTGPESLKVNGAIASTSRFQASSPESCYVPTDQTSTGATALTLGFERSRTPYRADALAGRQFQMPIPSEAELSFTTTDRLTFFEGGTGQAELTGQAFTWTVSASGVLDIFFADGTIVSYKRSASLSGPREYYVNALVTIPGQVEQGVIHGQEVPSTSRPFRRSDVPAEFHQVDVGSDYPLADPDPESGFYFILRDGGEGELASSDEPLHAWYIDAQGLLVIERTRGGGGGRGCDPATDEGCFIFQRRTWQLTRLSDDRYYVVEKINTNTSFDPSLPIESTATETRGNWYTRLPIGSSRQ